MNNKPKKGADGDTDVVGSRRSFLTTTSKGVTSTILASSLLGSPALAKQETTPPAVKHMDATLLRMTRDIYPHDKVDDKYYQQVVDKLLKDEAALMATGITELDNASQERLGASFKDVTYEPDRIRLLRSIESNPFFIKVRGTLSFGLYNNEELFPVFGYGGSSYEKGGYLNRGLNEASWLDKLD